MAQYCFWPSPFPCISRNRPAVLPSFSPDFPPPHDRCREEAVFPLKTLLMNFFARDRNLGFPSRVSRRFHSPPIGKAHPIWMLPQLIPPPSFHWGPRDGFFGLTLDELTSPFFFSGAIIIATREGAARFLLLFPPLSDVETLFQFPYFFLGFGRAACAPGLTVFFFFFLRDRPLFFLRLAMRRPNACFLFFFLPGLRIHPR